MTTRSFALIVAGLLLAAAILIFAIAWTIALAIVLPAFIEAIAGLEGPALFVVANLAAGVMLIVAAILGDWAEGPNITIHDETDEL